MLEVCKIEEDGLDLDYCMFLQHQLAELKSFHGPLGMEYVFHLLSFLGYQLAGDTSKFDLGWGYLEV